MTRYCTRTEKTGIHTQGKDTGTRLFAPLPLVSMIPAPERVCSFPPRRHPPGALRASGGIERTRSRRLLPSWVRREIFLK